MYSTPSPSDPSAYLESLMQAGQQSMKQFDDALVTALGVRGKSSSPIGPFRRSRSQWICRNSPLLNIFNQVLDPRG
jgi:hypothetical protein